MPRPCANPCPMCGHPKSQGNRYCRTCAAKVLAELKESGYLTQTSAYSKHRGADSKEKQIETKRGVME